MAHNKQEKPSADRYQTCKWITAHYNYKTMQTELHKGKIHTETILGQHIITLVTVKRKFNNYGNPIF